MLLLQRKVFSEIVQVFLLALAVILVLILMGRALQLREMLFGLELSIQDTLLLFAFMAPSFIQLAAPIACMIAVFIVFLRLESDREMIALKAGGISLYQLLPAPFIFSVIVSLLTLWVSLFWLAWGMDQFRTSIMEIATTKARIVVQPGVFNKDIPGLVLFARQVDPLSGTLSQVIIEDQSNMQAKTGNSTSSSSFTILAPEGHIDTDSKRGELIFLLKNGKIYTEQAQKSTLLSFNEYIIRLPLNKIFSGLDLGTVKPKEMSWHDLSNLPVTDIFLHDPRLANKIKVERHKRFVFPFACFVLGLLAVPMASACADLKKQKGVFIALFIFMIYYGILSLAIGLGETGQLSPYLGMWLPNILFLLLACLGIYSINNDVKGRLG